MYMIDNAEQMAEYCMCREILNSGERFNNKWGLRILPLPNVGGPPAKPTQEEYEELMNFLDQQADRGMQA